MNSISISSIDWSGVAERAFWPACIILTAFIVGLMLNRFIKRRIYLRLDTEEGSWKYVLVRALEGVPVSWCLGVGIYWSIGMLDFSPNMAKMLSYMLFAIIVYTLTRVAARTAGGVIDIHTQRDPSMPKSSLLTNIVNIIIYAMGILVILQYYGISIAPILTALGVGGMAVALALKDTLANIFSGLQLILTKQVRIGDYIRLTSGEEGQVSDINLRYTTLISILGNAVVIPNQNISASTLTNYDMPHRDIMVGISVGVAYGSDLEFVEQVTLDTARAIMMDIDETLIAEPIVRFHTFNESSIDFTVYLHSKEFKKQALMKHEFIKALTKRFRTEGIEIPFPIRTVYHGDRE